MKRMPHDMYAGMRLHQPRPGAREKAQYGTPCNNCGICCEIQTCPLGAGMFGSWRGPCPALERHSDGSATCGLVADPRRWAPVSAMLYGVDKLREGALLLIGSGMGCDAHVEGEKPDRAFARKLTFLARRSRRASLQALREWGIEP